MNRSLLFLLLFSVCIVPVLAYSESVPSFSDQDLDHYRKKSEVSRPSVDSGPASKSAVDIAPLNNDTRQTQKFEVPYTAFEGTARRVIIPVQFNGSVNARMALDTGSPGMIIFDRLANRLGVFERNDGNLLTFSAGLGGKTPSVLTIIDHLQVGSAEDRFIPTAVTQSLTDAFDGLIGMDFMANYAIRIDTARRTVVFEDLPDRQNIPGGHDELWWRDNFRNFAERRAEWKQFRDSLNTQKMDPERLEELKQFADRQYREADRLFTRLNNYAGTNSVPMHWRQY